MDFNKTLVENRGGIPVTAVPPLFLLCAYLFLSLLPALPAFCFVPDDELSAFRAGGFLDLV